MRKIAMCLMVLGCVSTIPSVGCQHGCEPAKAYLASMEDMSRDAEVALYEAQKLVKLLPESEDRTRGIKAITKAAEALTQVRKTLNVAAVACTSPSPSALFDVFNQAWTVIKLVLIPIIADPPTGYTPLRDPDCYAYRRR